jgi:hypothetical protein
MVVVVVSLCERESEEEEEENVGERNFFGKVRLTYSSSTSMRKEEFLK